MPHSPQFLSSVCTLTQLPLQVRLLPPQTQAPCAQVWPSGQSTPTHALSWQAALSTQTFEGSHGTPLQLVG